MLVHCNSCHYVKKEIEGLGQGDLLVLLLHWLETLQMFAFLLERFLLCCGARLVGCEWSLECWRIFWEIATVLLCLSYHTLFVGRWSKNIVVYWILGLSVSAFLPRISDHSILFLDGSHIGFLQVGYPTRVPICSIWSYQQPCLPQTLVKFPGSLCIPICCLFCRLGQWSVFSNQLALFLLTISDLRLSSASLP